MQITLDTTDSQDLELLGALVNALGVKRGTETLAEPAKAASAPAKKTAAAKPAPTPEPEAPADSGDPSATLEEAVARATKLVSDGKATDVKAALDACGAGKVSELPAEKIDDFLAELDKIG